MANLKEVKNRISSVSSTQQITKAMKMVAAAKLRRAQDKITQMRPYSQRMSEVISNVTSGMSEGVENPFAEERDVNRVLIVVVSSDRGLCGAFNSSVFKGAVSLIKEKYQYQMDMDQCIIMPIGKKAHDYFKKRDYLMVERFSHLIHDLSFENAREAGQYILEEFESGYFDKVEIVYNEFKNVATQVLVKEQFLPVAPISEEDLEEKASSKNVDYIFEPTKEFIFKEIVPKSLKIQFYKALLESNASEHGARMTAMDKATDNAGELLKELRLTYNRTRQAAITKEILEIVGGAEALASE
ncbi:MAG: ATP synthase F1 subunit gamma [bacterium]|nr:ATP synthase F1 subunit gamma [bacterium]